MISFTSFLRLGVERVKKLGRSFYPVSLFIIGLICSTWGHFHPQAPFWQYILLSSLMLPVYWFLSPKDTHTHTEAHQELENTIKLLKQSEQGYSKLFELLPVPAIVHTQGVITYVNKAAMNLMGGVSSGDIIGKTIYRFVDSEYYQKINKQIQKIRSKTEEKTNFEEYTILRLDGQRTSVDVSSMVLQIDGYELVLTILHDISFRKKEEEMVRKMAYVCQLTQLPNRRSFEETLNEKLFDSKQSNLPFYLLFIDLDGFKKVNDTLGHDAGDMVLQMVAQRLTYCVRSGDFVSRYAGDEFIVLLTGIELEDAINIAKRMIRAIESTMIIKGEEVNITASIGISSSQKDGETSKQLIRRADQAMYSAKQKGKNNYHIYHSS
jgi:diguanylate cyclase (GGDEF)-like protein/PAS domain S-box-containing protein